MDKCSTDAEFDSYWDNEAKNQNRNRIRVGRQYQATIPPLLKPGEKDGRKLEDLETLKWKPDQLSDQKLEEYMSMAKGISLFSKSVSSSRSPEKSDNSLQSAIKGLTEFVASHHPCHHDDGCRQVLKPSSSSTESVSKVNTNTWSQSEAQLFAQALEACGKNFSAIKKEFLPWKPVRSIIEYYYQIKNEKAEETEPTDKVIPKAEEEPIPSCSHEEKPCVKEEPVKVEEPQVKTVNTEDPPKDSINFLDHSRVTDPCSAASETSLPQDVPATSTVGSLKFFLGGRLVLKLNAQQDGGSGNKCQWVQSNDLPKHSNHNKKDKHKKKFAPYSYSSSGTQKPLKKGDDTSAVPDCDPSGIKKPRLKEYETSENSALGLLLCSSSWTPPVADGQESIDVDDTSSKTSEGYISPILSNNYRTSKIDTIKHDFASNPNTSNELGEQKCDSDPTWVKTDNCIISDSASKNASVLSGKNSPNQCYSSPMKKEVLNHKSALSHGRSVKSPCYQSRSSHSSSPLLKQRNIKWSNIPYPLKSSPSSLSPVYIDLRSSTKESAIDLSSKSDNGLNNADHYVKQTHSNERSECNECILCESDSRPDSEFSPQSSNFTPSAESPRKEPSCTACNCCEGVSTDQLPFDNSGRKEDETMTNKESDDNSQLSYTYCNLPYHCALPKCTKDYTLEEHLCNKSSINKNQVDCPEYIINDIDENMCEKNPNWCSKASYIPYYSHCYPYYVSYGVTSRNSAESTDTEVSEAPLDLSSTNETKPEKLPNVEKISENSSEEVSQNAEGGRGMLYQLLKNKSK
ncbi:uncharacterized protein [Parasteatoda tepidariorum]|uniref:uncharacterized protein n=1 Tax=Parasteatoda tepidariorum TaxID=114398 RepID=UPI001C719931|nr:arginine-glutamic acid dipeptide repeats protein [Parasteatoda tepidariorum]